MKFVKNSALSYAHTKIKLLFSSVAQPKIIVNIKIPQSFLDSDAYKKEVNGSIKLAV